MRIGPGEFLHRALQAPTQQIGNETLRQEHTRGETWASCGQTEAARAQGNLDQPADRKNREHMMKQRSTIRGSPPAQREKKVGQRRWSTLGYEDPEDSALFSCLELFAFSPPGSWQYRSGYAEPSPVPLSTLGS